MVGVLATPPVVDHLELKVLLLHGCQHHCWVCDECQKGR